LRAKALDDRLECALVALARELDQTLVARARKDDRRPAQRRRAGGGHRTNPTAARARRRAAWTDVRTRVTPGWRAHLRGTNHSTWRRRRSEMSRKLDLRKFDLSGSRRAESSMRNAAAWALAAASICALAALPAPAAGEWPGASASVSAEEAPVSASATVTVADPSGKASEVLQLLTIPQLESILGAAPGQLTSVVEKLTGGPLGPKLRELLAGP